MHELSIDTFLKEYDYGIDTEELSTKIKEAVKSGEDVTISNKSFGTSSLLLSNNEML